MSRPQPSRDDLALDGGLPLAAGRRRRCGSTPTSRPSRRRPAFADALADELARVDWHRYPDRAAAALRAAHRRAARRRRRPGLRGQRLERGAADAAASPTAGPAARSPSFEPTYALHSHIARLTGTDGRRGRARRTTSRSTSTRCGASLAEPPTRRSRSCARPTTRPAWSSRRTIVRGGARRCAPGPASSSTRPTGSSRRGRRSSWSTTTRPLVVTRTFSKTWSMAAARLGYLDRPGLGRRRARQGRAAVPPRRGQADRRHARARASPTRWRRGSPRWSRSGAGSSPRSRDLPVDVWPSGANFVLFRPHDRRRRRGVAGSCSTGRCSCATARRGPGSTAACASPSARRHEDDALPRRARRRSSTMSSHRERASAHDQGDDDRDRRRPRRHRPQPTVAPACPFFDHMLDQLGRHGGFDLTVQAKGDLEVDAHHTVEDVGITARRDASRGARRQGRRAPLRQRPVPARRGAGRGRARPVGPAVRRVRRPVRRGAAARRPAVQPGAGRALLAVVRDRGRHHAARRTRCGAATRTTSSRRRSRAWPAACATRCASRAAACRRPRARCDAGRVRSSRCSTTASATCARPQKALEQVGADARLTADRGLIADAAGVVLPGVGAFGRCMEALRAAGLDDGRASTPSHRGRPFLGICVGMQLLYDGIGRDRRASPASGVCPAVVRRLPDGVKRPADAVERLDVGAADPLLEGLDPSAWMYFVHSYAPDDVDRSASPRATTAARSSPRSSAATCGPRSSTRRSRRRRVCGSWPTCVGTACAAMSWTRAVPGHRPAGRRCVRLYQGDYAGETVYGDDPVAVRRADVRRRRARRGSTSSTSTPPAPASRATGRHRRDRGRRSTACRCRPAAACAPRTRPPPLADAGVARVVIGTAALEDPDLVAPRRRRAQPRRRRARRPRRRGRGARLGRGASGRRSARRRSTRFADAGVDARIVTEIARDGTLEGPTSTASHRAARTPPMPLIASGGVGHARRPRRAGRPRVDGRRLAGAIVGRALYEGRFACRRHVGARSPVVRG